MAGRVSAGPGTPAQGGGAGLAGTPMSGRPRGGEMGLSKWGIGGRSRPEQGLSESEKGEQWQGNSPPQTPSP